MSTARLVRELCVSGRIKEAIQPIYSSSIKCDPQTYAFLLQETINRKNLNLGKIIHSHMIISGHIPNHYLSNKLLVLYARHGQFDYAHYLFDVLSQPTAVSWNAMISGYVHMGMDQNALNFYSFMRASGFYPDHFTFASILRACARLAKLEDGKQVHCVLIKSNVTKHNVVVNSALVDMYFKCSNPLDGHRVFDRTLDKNVITWTAIISGYGHLGNVGEVIKLFHKMIEFGYRPNSITFLAILSACSHGGLVDDGWKYFYSMEREYNISPKGEHYAAIVDMLGRAGRLNEAYDFVIKSPFKERSIIWGGLLGACSLYGYGNMGRVVADKFFELQPMHVGKHIVLCNIYAGLEMWERVDDMRRDIQKLGVKKEPASSSIEIRGEVYTFLAGDTYHEEHDMIYATLNALNFSLIQI